MFSVSIELELITLVNFCIYIFIYNWTSIDTPHVQLNATSSLSSSHSFSIIELPLLNPFIFWYQWIFKFVCDWIPLAADNQQHIHLCDLLSMSISPCFSLSLSLCLSLSSLSTFQLLSLFSLSSPSISLSLPVSLYLPVSLLSHSNYPFLSHNSLYLSIALFPLSPSLCLSICLSLIPLCVRGGTAGVEYHFQKN